MMTTMMMCQHCFQVPNAFTPQLICRKKFAEQWQSIHVVGSLWSVGGVRIFEHVQRQALFPFSIDWKVVACKRPAFPACPVCHLYVIAFLDLRSVWDRPMIS
jgi:hypothetical protein